MLKNLVLFSFLVCFGQLAAGGDKTESSIPAEEWADVRYSDKKTEFNFSIPGDPKQEQGEITFSYKSEYNGTKYHVRVLTQGTPKNSTEAEKIMDGMKLPYTKIEPSPFDGVLAYQLESKDNPAVGRIYFSQSAGYFFAVEGNDLSEADNFFNSVQITK